MNWLDFTLRDSFTDRQTISFSLTPDINEKQSSQLLSLSLFGLSAPLPVVESLRTSTDLVLLKKCELLRSST